MTTLGNKWIRRPELWVGIVSFLLGLLFLFATRYSQLRHIIVRAKHGAIVDPWQGYLVAFLFFTMTALTVAHTLWSTRD